MRALEKSGVSSVGVIVTFVGGSTGVVGGDVVGVGGDVVVVGGDVVVVGGGAERTCVSIDVTEVRPCDFNESTNASFRNAAASVVVVSPLPLGTATE